MKRPSHWILLSVATVSALLWTTGRFDLVTGDAKGPKVVRLDKRKLPAPPALMALRGRVIDSLGWPVEGAQVRLQPAGAQVRCDAQGAYQLTVPGAGPHLLEIAAPQHRTAYETSIVGELPVTTLAPVSLAAAAPPAAAAGALGDGFLKTEDGAPCRDAIVTVCETGQRAVADAVGHFLVPMPVGDVTLIARDAQGRVARIGPIANATTQGKVPLDTTVLRPGRVLHGIVRDAGGEPRGQANVVVSGHGLRLHATTDTGGGFRVDGMVDGQYDVEALPFHGWLGTRREVAVQGAVTDLGDLELVAERPRRLRVIDTAAQGLADVVVLVREADSDRLAEGRTNADGYVALSGLDEGAVTFEVFAAATRKPIAIVRYEVQDQVDQLVVRP